MKGLVNSDYLEIKVTIKNERFSEFRLFVEVYLLVYWSNRRLPVISGVYRSAASTNKFSV